MNGAILWSSKRLKIVADSTAHAETAEASRSVKSGTFVRMVCEGIGRPAVGPTSVLGDNKAMNDLVNKEGSSQLSRHFERATILVKYAVQRLLVACHATGCIHSRALAGATRPQPHTLGCSLRPSAAIAGRIPSNSLSLSHPSVPKARRGKPATTCVL